MFYITAHTITQNQFANTIDECQLTNSDGYTQMGIEPPAPLRLAATHINNMPIMLIPNNLHTFNNNFTLTDKQKNGDLHEIVIGDGLR